MKIKYSELTPIEKKYCKNVNRYSNRFTFYHTKRVEIGCTKITSKPRLWFKAFFLLVIVPIFFVAYLLIGVAQAFMEAIAEIPEAWNLLDNVEEIKYREEWLKDK